jgi:hypothetical protein
VDYSWNGILAVVGGIFDGIFLQGALGLVYRFETVALRVELGSGLMRIGVGFAF